MAKKSSKKIKSTKVKLPSYIPNGGMYNPSLKSKPSMQFPVGAGLTGNQQIGAYKKVAPNSVMATGIQSVKPAVDPLQPKYSPMGGYNTQANGYTFTKDGWIKGTQNYTPMPGLPAVKPKTSSFKNTINQGTTSGTQSSQSSSSLSSPITPVTSPTASSTTATTPTSITQPTPTATAGDLIAGNSEFDYNLTPEQRAYEEALREQAAYNQKQSQLNVNPESIYQDTLAQFQGEIDAVNQIYAQKLAEAKMQGQSRLGTTRAENFNAGAVDSSFGNAAQERTQQYNTDIEGGIQAEKLQMIGQIESNARTLGQKYYEAKKAAKEAGLESYVANLKGVKEAKDTITTEIANNMLMSSITPDELTPKKLEQIAKSAGVTVQSIKTTYKELKAAKDAAEAEVARKGQFNLSEGQARYDAKGNLIASRAKTYKGGSGTGFGGATVSEAALNFAKQIQSGAATLQNVPSAMRAEVATALMQLPSQKVQELDQVINLIDELATNPKLDNITGPTDQFIGGVFGKAALAKNLYNQLQGVLALEGRSKLKGSGAISDFEFRVLKDAQSALGRNLPASVMRAELEKVKNILAKRRQTLISQGFMSDTSTEEDTQDTIDTENPPEQVTMPDGTVLTLQADGTYE